MSETSTARSEGRDLNALAHELTHEIEQAMLDDPLLEDDWLWSLMSGYAVDLPGLLVDMLDEPATVVNMVRAKIRVMRHLAKSRWPEQIKRLPGVAPGIIQNLLSMATQLEASLAGIPEALQRAGLTDAQALIAGPPAASPALTGLLSEGGTTIGDVLVTQPSMLLLNN